MDAKLPLHVTLKDISATYNQDTIPRHLQSGELLHQELWAQVVVAEGELNLKLAGQQARITPAAPVIIPPNTRFSLTGTGKPVVFHLNYYHEPVFADGKSLASQMGRRVA